MGFSKAIECKTVEGQTLYRCQNCGRYDTSLAGHPKNPTPEDGPQICVPCFGHAFNNEKEEYMARAGKVKAGVVPANAVASRGHEHEGEPFLMEVEPTQSEMPEELRDILRRASRPQDEDLFPLA